MITFRELESTIEVSGTYNEMVGVMSKLKARGFRWDPSRKVWWSPKAKLTPMQISNVKKLVDGVNTDVAEVTKGVAEANTEAAEKLFKDALELKFTGFLWKVRGKALLLSGRTYDVKDYTRDAGGVWLSGDNAYLFELANVKPAGFKRLLDTMTTMSNRWAVQIAKVVEYLSKAKEWPTLGIKMLYNNQRNSVDISGNTREYRNDIKNEIPDARWDSSSWYVGRTQVTQKQLEDLAKLLDRDEAKALAQREAQPTEEKPKETQERRIPNRKPGPCHTCGEYVKSGDGYIRKIYDPNFESSYNDDDDDGQLRWVIFHSDPKICEANKEAARILREKARNKQDARNSLRDLSCARKYYAEGKHDPHGEKIYIDKNSLAYGGGSWVIIEPNEDFFWYIQNNGADGDDWSHNNITTNGAGAIGYRVPLTVEARILIDAAKE